MTTNRDFKRVVRDRMGKTGESYTTARATLLRKAPPRTRAHSTAAKPAAKPAASPNAHDADAAPTTAPDAAALAERAGMSNEAVAAKTGCGWEKWTFVLDKAGAHMWSHAEIAKHVAERYKVSGWWAQTVTVGYERIRGLREKGQRRSGSYEANKSRTYAVPVEELFAAFRDARRRAKWLPGVKLTVRTATAARSIRCTWPDGTSVEGWFVAKGASKSTVSVQHTRLTSRDDAEQRKRFWGERLDALGEYLGR